MKPATAVLAALAAVLACASSAYAQTDVLIEVARGRTEGDFSKSPVYQRAILSKPAVQTDTAVLFFRGYPGIARIESLADKQRNLIPFLRMTQQLFHDAGVALMIVDCPTDQWGVPGPEPTACLDGYRSSKTQADDVRAVMARLRDEHGIRRMFIFGHSFGSISSRWLAKYLGGEISGSIHSASMNGWNRRGYGSSLAGFDYGALAAPALHVHNEDDACPGTPYAAVKAYAGANLVTVRGGLPVGDRCGGRHLHSYAGREAAVVTAILAWVKTGKVIADAGE